MENLDKIERYLANKMEAEERQDFEELLKNDAELRRQKEDFEALIIGIKAEGFRQKIKDKKIGAQDYPHIVESSKLQTNVRSFNLRRLAIAASLIGGLVTAWWVMSPKSVQDQYYAQTFTPDPGLPTPMSEVTNYSFMDAMVEYKMGHYEMAIETWKNEQKVGKDTLDYYLGMAYLNLKNYEQASIALERLTPDSKFYSKAKWQKVGMLMAQDKYDEALKLLKEIPPDYHPDYDKIKKILEEK